MNATATKPVGETEPGVEPAADAAEGGQP
jgi:hypothetical protein